MSVSEGNRLKHGYSVVSQKIDNPTLSWDNEKLDHESYRFANKVYNNIATKEQRLLFFKAGRIAKYGWRHQRINAKIRLSALEQDAFKSKNFWDQPKTLKVTMLMLSVSAIVQGWIQTSANGANQTWAEKFKIYYSNSQPGSEISWTDREIWIYAGVNAITYLVAGVVGCWLSDPLQLMRLPLGRGKSFNVGRRGAIFLSACLCFASSIGAACAKNWQQLMICRALLGWGMGAKAAITPIFGAEVSPNNLRGALVMNWQLFDAVGVLCGFTANLIAFPYSDLSWRVQMGSVCLPSVCLLTIAFTVPESPRWLLKHGKFRDAFDAMVLLRQDPLVAATELFYANAQLQVEVKHLKSRSKNESSIEKQASSFGHDVEDGNDSSYYFQETVKLSSYWLRLTQLFSNARTRHATIAAGVVMIGQQLCGVNALLFYSSTLFRDVNGVITQNSTDTQNPTDLPNPSDHPDQDKQALQALFLSWGVGIANVIFIIPAYYMIDTRGRRALLLGTYPGMILAMLAASLSFLIKAGTLRETLFIIFVFVFFFFYSWGQGPVAFTYSSEVFPLFNREVGMSFAVSVNFIGAGLLTLFVPFSSKNTESDVYGKNQVQLLGIFTGFNVVALILIFLFVPETKYAVEHIYGEDQRSLKYISLEELDSIFSVKSWRFMWYQIHVWLPWSGRILKYKIQRFADPTIRPSKKPTKPDLCEWVEDAEANGEDDNDDEYSGDDFANEDVAEFTTGADINGQQAKCDRCGQRIRQAASPSSPSNAH